MRRCGLSSPSCIICISKNRYCSGAPWNDLLLLERIARLVAYESFWSLSFPLRLLSAILFSLCLAVSLSAQIVPTNDPPVYGPYNAVILQGGDGLRKNMVAKDTVLRADSPWTIYCWVQTDAAITAPVLVAGYGDVAGEYSRFLGLDAGKLMLWMGADNSFSAPATITPGKWQFVAATFDGSVFRLYGDGAQVGQGSLTLGTSSSSAADCAAADPVTQWTALRRQDCRPHSDARCADSRSDQTGCIASAVVLNP